MLAEEPLRIVALTLALMALKAAVLYAAGAALPAAGRARLLFALALAQAGEFGFFLLGFAARDRGAAERRSRTRAAGGRRSRCS